MNANVIPRLALVLSLMACAQSGTAQNSASTRAARAEGERAYLRVGCHACHGTVGHGGAGPKLAPNTLPLAAFEAWVRRGTPGWTITSGMPAFPADLLSDDELADVRAFLAGLPEPKPPEQIPLLRD